MACAFVGENVALAPLDTLLRASAACAMGAVLSAAPCAPVDTFALCAIVVLTSAADLVPASESAPEDTLALCANVRVGVELGDAVKAVRLAGPALKPPLGPGKGPRWGAAAPL